MKLEFFKSILRQYKAKKRNKLYAAFLESCCDNTMTVQGMVDFGHRVMRKARIHPHFFGQNSLLATAYYLTFFYLKLPHEYTNPQYINATVTAAEAAGIIALFEKRISERMPVEYITNESWYCGNKFYVTPDVLVPRSIMNYRFTDFLNAMQWENYRVLDLCTGSGCIGITLALQNPRIKVDLVDISAQALAVAAINIKNHDLQDRVTCIQSNVFENVKDKYDLIITNPPYATNAEYNTCPAEFKNEPRIAITCGTDGLMIIHQILRQAKQHLNPQGKLIAEVGYSAAKRLKKQYRKVPFQWFKYRRPTGKESLFGMHGVFLCEAKGLPDLR